MQAPSPTSQSMQMLAKPAAIALLSAIITHLVYKWIHARGTYLSDMQKFLVDFLVVFVSAVIVCWAWKKWGNRMT